ncbi:MAG: prolyl aminopeptidase [Oceanospirillaceae bacterium]
MHEFFPEIEPYNHFMIEVDSVHKVYVEQCGNPDGQPVVFLHGGPGGGCSSNDRRFFDPQRYRIILLDQRGCGRSLPFGCLIDNTTAALIADIELIREALKIEQWHVFGGSWGSTLSLTYAQAHPKKVLSLVLRGIFLGRKQDTSWTFEGGGATRLYPDYWQEYLQALPPGTAQSSVQVAYDILTGSDKEAALRLARAWAKWEISCCTLIPDAKFVESATDDEKSWTLARHEAHFMIHDCFLTDNQILQNCPKIKDIKMIIVHGRYDIVCPFDNAWALKQALPNAQLVVSESAGHASIEAETKHHLINATQAMLAIS